jgi:hypothetical protein
MISLAARGTFQIGMFFLEIREYWVEKCFLGAARG